MPISVKTLYDSIPYDVLADPELGPLPTTAKRKDVDARYARLVRKGRTPERQAAWDILINPGKRAGWDIFCSAADRGQDPLRKLIEAAPTFEHEASAQLESATIEDLIDWESAGPPAAPTQPVRREVGLVLSSLYDEPESVLREIDFDL